MSKPATFARVLLAAALVAALLSLSVESHEAHPVGNGLARDAQLVSTVCHPELELHIEAADTVTVPSCPACLLHLNNLEVGTSPVGPTAGATSSGRPVSPADPVLPASWHLPGPSRAPPRS